jgi:hypothetical protein
VNVAVDHEHELLLSTVRAFMAAEIYPHEDMVDRLGHVPDDLGRQIERRAIEAGLYSANLPEAVGGGGLGKRAMMLIEREYGKTSHALHSWIGRPTEILLACEGDQVERYLLPCVRAEKRELFALTEPEAGSDVMGMKSNARRDGADWILNGSKHFISGPCMPDFAIVFAATGTDETKRGPRKRITAFLVDVGTPGFEIREGNRSVSYRGYKTFQLHFSDVRLGPGQILGEEQLDPIEQLRGRWFLLETGRLAHAIEGTERLGEQLSLEARMVDLDDPLHRLGIREPYVVEEATAQESIRQLFLVVAGDDDHRPVARFDELTGLVDIELHAIELAQKIVRELDVSLVDLVDQEHGRLGRIERLPELSAHEVVADVGDAGLTEL